MAPVKSVMAGVGCGGAGPGAGAGGADRLKAMTGRANHRVVDMVRASSIAMTALTESGRRLKKPDLRAKFGTVIRNSIRLRRIRQKERGA